MIMITNESYRGSCSDGEATFRSVSDAERAMTRLFGEPITLVVGDYQELPTCATCGGLVNTSSDGSRQCEDCGRLVA
jgi:hypothetical protein